MDRCIDEKLGILAAQYAMGVLTDEERDRFEEHLMDCDFCFREVEAMAPILSAMRRHRAAILAALDREASRSVSSDRELFPLRAQGRPLYESLDRKLTRVIGGLRRGLTWGVVGLVVGIIVGWYAVSPELRSLFMAENRFMPECDRMRRLVEAPALRSHLGTEGEALFRQGLEAYQHNEFKDAISNLRRAVRADPNQGNWWLWLGLCYYFNGQPKRAIKSLMVADTLTGFYIKTQVRWYLAQAYLMMNDPDRALHYHDWIIAQGDRTQYYEKAISQKERVLALKGGGTQGTQ